MNNKEIIVATLGTIVSGAIIINALTLYFYSIYNERDTSIVVLISLFSFYLLWKSIRKLNKKGIGYSLTFYLVVHITCLLWGLLWKEFVTTPSHWGFG